MKREGTLTSKGEETHRFFGGQLNQQKVEPQKTVTFPQWKLHLQESTWFVDGRPFTAQIRPIADTQGARKLLGSSGVTKTW